MKPTYEMLRIPHPEIPPNSPCALPLLYIPPVCGWLSVGTFNIGKNNLWWITSEHTQKYSWDLQARGRTQNLALILPSENKREAVSRQYVALQDQEYTSRRILPKDRAESMVQVCPYFEKAIEDFKMHWKSERKDHNNFPVADSKDR